MTDATESTGDAGTDEEWRSPVDDGWEPDKPKRGPIEWARDNPDRSPIGWFRASPARFFAILGTILFVGGWGATIYIALNADVFGRDDPLTYQLQIIVSIGSSVTLASAVLWGIAVYIWMHLLPDLPPEIAAQLATEESSPTNA